jgi:hypothetical protein
MITRSASARAAGIQRASTPILTDFWNGVNSPPGTPTRKRTVNIGGNKKPARLQKISEEKNEAEMRLTGWQKWTKRFEELGEGNIEAGALNFIRMASNPESIPHPPLPRFIRSVRNSANVSLHHKISVLTQILSEDFKPSETPHPSTGLIQHPDDLTALNALSKLERTGGPFNDVEREIRHDLRASLRYSLLATFLFKNIIPQWWNEVAMTNQMAEAVSTTNSPNTLHREYYEALKYSNYECKNILVTIASKREEEAIWDQDWSEKFLQYVKENARKLLPVLEAQLEELESQTNE